MLETPVEIYVDSKMRIKAMVEKDGKLGASKSSIFFAERIKMSLS